LGLPTRFSFSLSAKKQLLRAQANSRREEADCCRQLPLKLPSASLFLATIQFKHSMMKPKTAKAEYYIDTLCLHWRTDVLMRSFLNDNGSIEYLKD